MQKSAVQLYGQSSFFVNPLACPLKEFAIVILHIFLQLQSLSICKHLNETHVGPLTSMTSLHQMQLSANNLQNITILGFPAMIFSSGYNIIISAVASFSKLQPFVLMPDTSLICSPAFFKAAQCFCSISSQSSKVQAARIIRLLTWTQSIAESINEK